MDAARYLIEADFCLQVARNGVHLAVPGQSDLIVADALNGGVAVEESVLRVVEHQIARGESDVRASHSAVFGGKNVAAGRRVFKELVGVGVQLAAVQVEGAACEADFFHGRRFAVNVSAAHAAAFADGHSAALEGHGGVAQNEAALDVRASAAQDQVIDRGCAGLAVGSAGDIERRGRQRALFPDGHGSALEG